MPAHGLPDVVEINIPEQKHFNGEDWPLVLSPDDAHRDKEAAYWNQWVKDNMVTLKKVQLHYGAILYRGFRFEAPTDFDLFIKSFGYPNFVYMGGAAPRYPVVGDVFTSTEAPSTSTISYHNEMSQVPINPEYISFYCDVVPGEGGETPVLPGDIAYKLMKELEPEFMERLQREGTRFQRVSHDGDLKTSALGRGWQSTWHTNDRAVAEERCRAHGTAFEWLDDGAMKTTTPPVKSVHFDKRTGKTHLFSAVNAGRQNQGDIHNHPITGTQWPDGTPLPDGPVYVLNRVLDSLACKYKWQKNDVIVIDNRTTLHGRLPFKPPRRILAVLNTDPEDRHDRPGGEGWVRA